VEVVVVVAKVLSFLIELELMLSIRNVEEKFALNVAKQED